MVDEISAYKFIYFAHGTFWKNFGPIHSVSLFYIMSAVGWAVGFAFLYVVTKSIFLQRIRHSSGVQIVYYRL